ncbi:MAG: hypothetical protein IKX92_04535, partial [Clostridia bacterium]|nr:hypothetical protein [Clostridia bacterium]
MPYNAERADKNTHAPSAQVLLGFMPLLRPVSMRVPPLFARKIIPYFTPKKSICQRMILIFIDFLQRIGIMVKGGDVFMF